ncbi:hypothetical protein ABZ484_28915 [Streptomyces sp. NPDC006393]|uniref:LexA family protein n=1 Tax=Streptomyces sp. NPDC006393 TaxID=3156763 RepID=UPI0033C223AB
MNRRPDHLSEREEQILRCIRRRIEEEGEGHSVRQLAHAVGMRSTASVAHRLTHRSPHTNPEENLLWSQ